MIFPWQTLDAIAVLLLPLTITLHWTLQFLAMHLSFPMNQVMETGPLWGMTGSLPGVTKFGCMKIYAQSRATVLELVGPHTFCYWVWTHGLLWCRAGGVRNPFLPTGASVRRFCRSSSGSPFSLMTQYCLPWAHSRIDCLTSNSTTILWWGSQSGNPTGCLLHILWCGGVATPE